VDGFETAHRLPARFERLQTAHCRPGLGARRGANASIALEGMHMTSEDLALQQRVIDGEWTFEQYHEHIRGMLRKTSPAFS
jgi:hypothetical protein